LMHLSEEDFELLLESKRRDREWVKHLMIINNGQMNTSLDSGCSHYKKHELNFMRRIGPDEEIINLESRMRENRLYGSEGREAN